MAKIISCSLNLSKVDKAKLFTGKTGDKYLNIDIIVNDEKDKFGNDVSISEKQSKEERERKEKKNYLGNGKTVWTGESKKQNQPAQGNSVTLVPDDNSDLPF